MIDKINQIADRAGIEVHFGTIPQNDRERANGFIGVISVVLQLSKAVIREIKDKPTHEYFHHYRTANAYIDRVCMEICLMIEREGYLCLPIAASQSINKNGNEYSGRYSSKKAAVLCGGGTIGKSGLFLHKEHGGAVRLGTILTNFDFGIVNELPDSICDSCEICVKSCPAGAIYGNAWNCEQPNKCTVDPAICSKYMKDNFIKIGRGAVCGICIRSCPLSKIE